MATLKERSKDKGYLASTPRPTPIARRRTKVREGVTDAAAILKHRYVGKNPARNEAFEQVSRDMALGLKLRQAREEAGLTQTQLAKKIGTQSSAISRLEDADYDGHSMETLRRVADALRLVLVVDFIHRADLQLKE